jgi:glycosyltransferase involved in cell wall biosynthesis
MEPTSNREQSPKEVSIVVPICNYEKSMATIAAIRTQTLGRLSEIIAVYDNPCSPPSKEYLKFIKAGGIKLIENKTNLGLAESYNIGAKAAKYENVIYFHEDCVPQPGLIADMLEKMKLSPIVNGMVLLPDQVVAKYDFWNRMMLYRHSGRFCEALGKATGIKKEVFRKIGYFDSKTFRTSSEDMDFSTRALAAGIKIDHVDKYVEHQHEAKSATSLTMFKKEWQLGEGHGAYKRKHNLKRVGQFDFEFRLGILLLTALGVYSVGWQFLIALFPFILIPLYQAIVNYSKSGYWLPGLLLYPFIGPIVLIVQTIAATKCFLTGVQTF